MPRLLAAASLAVLALAGCKGSGEPDPNDTSIPKGVVGEPKALTVEESQYGTPVKDRVGTLGLLNKRNNLTQELKLKSGESVRVGNVVVRLASCERSLPWEQPRQTGAFVQVFVEERQSADQALAWRKVFSGWLFKESPSLNVVEHPVYDVWVKDCAMKFPGEEEDPAAASSSAAKPAGKASPSPAPAATATASAAPPPAKAPAPTT